MKWIVRLQEGIEDVTDCPPRVQVLILVAIIALGIAQIIAWLMPRMVEGSDSKPAIEVVDGVVIDGNHDENLSPESSRTIAPQASMGSWELNIARGEAVFF